MKVQCVMEFEWTTKAIFFPEYFMILSTSRTFPGAGKRIYCFPRCMGTFSQSKRVFDTPLKDYIINDIKNSGLVEKD